MASILITGSEGLVGRALRAALADRGHEVAGYDIAAAEGSAERGNILDAELLQARSTGVDGIVHLAAVSRVAHGEADPEACWRTNVTGTERVLEAAMRSSARPWVIVASSREVYGEPDRLPVREDDPVEPVNVYGRSKAACEQVTHAAARDRGLRTALVRLASVYGSVHDHPDRVVPAFCRAAAAGAPMRVEGAGYTFDFTHVADVADGLSRLAELMAADRPPPPVLHLVTGQGTTLGDLAHLANAAGGGRSKLHITGNKGYNVSRFVGCPQRARATLGWRAETPIEEGVRRLVQDFRRLHER